MPIPIGYTDMTNHLLNKRVICMPDGTNHEVKEIWIGGADGANHKVWSSNNIRIVSVVEHAVEGTGVGNTSYKILNGVATFAVKGSISQYYSPKDGCTLTNTCYLEINCAFEQPLDIIPTTPIVAKFNVSGGGFTGSPACYSGLYSNIVTPSKLTEYGDVGKWDGNVTIDMQAGSTRSAVTGFNIQLYNYVSGSTSTLVLKSGDFMVSNIPLTF